MFFGKMDNIRYFASLIIILFFIIEFGIFCCVAKNSSSGCIERERKALLKFRASFVDSSNKLSSWKADEANCCIWEGVSCNETTGHIIRLDLRNNYGKWLPNASLNSSVLQSASLDSSILELKHLNYLDLSGNDFNGSTIPAFLGSMEELQYLNLSYGSFGGVLPPTLGNLSNIRTLVLADPVGGSLIVNDLTWASNLSSLEYLNLNYIDLGRTKDLAKVFNLLPSLVMLGLSHSELTNHHLSHACVNFTLFSNLQHLDLSSNKFYGEFPCFLHNMTSLRLLDLSDNQYNTSDTHFVLRSRNLVYVDLSRNLISLDTNWISKLLWDRCHLKSLSLGNNKFYGEISVVFNNLSGCWSHGLERLRLGYNNFYGHLPNEIDGVKQLIHLDLSGSNISGPIPISLGNLLALEVLDISYNTLSGPIPISLGNLLALEALVISYNMLSGPIPSSFGNMKKLREFRIDSNQLCGEIPISMGNLDNLQTLVISNNSFNGKLSEAHFSNLSKLKNLDITSTMIKFQVQSNWVPPFQLEEFYVGSNFYIGGPFPLWLTTQKALKALHLSNCSISGALPESLGSMNLTHLSLSKNSITGTIPQLPSTLISLDLSHNMIHHISSNIHHMLPNLESLDLSKNHINGTIPNLPSSLVSLDLSDNMIHHIPSNIRHMLPNLKYLDLSKNQINGTIPNFPSSLVSLDLSDNMIHHIPNNIGHMLPRLQFLLLGRNSINGIVPISLCRLKYLVDLDLSKNYLSGNLLDCWQNFPTLRYLLLSSNKFSGTIPKSIGHAHSLEILRLHNNNLEGQLPTTLRNCRLLNILDVGGNMLSGEIPEWIGNHLLDLRFLRLRNNQFHGVIPTMLCQASKLQIIDLGDNSLSGHIQHCLTNFSGMSFPIDLATLVLSLAEGFPQVLKGLQLEYTNLGYLANLDLSCNFLVGEIPLELTSLVGLRGLNLSFNMLQGQIPMKIGRLKLLESLDLSNNHLTGRIPNSLSDITSLEYLNLSNNDLSGQIPMGPQLQTLGNPSIYGGNPLLCGTPLLKKCGGDEAQKGSKAENHVGTNEGDKICLSASVIGGFATGLWGFIGILVFKQKWRHAYIRFIDHVLGKMVGY